MVKLPNAIIPAQSLANEKNLNRQKRQKGEPRINEQQKKMIILKEGKGNKKERQKPT